MLSKKYLLKKILSLNKEQAELWAEASEIRKVVWQDKVELRSVIEYTNLCQQACRFCSLGSPSQLKQFIMSNDMAYKIIKNLYKKKMRRVIMIQTGEISNTEVLANLIGLMARALRDFPELTIIGCFGNLLKEEYEKIYDIGVTRYILKFETSDKNLYHKLKPLDTLANRLKHLYLLRKLGFKVGTGNICGLPGQSISSLVDDLLLIKEFSPPMASTAIFIPNKHSLCAQEPAGNINVTLNFMALLRIFCPQALIPSTSSLNNVDKDGQYKGLLAGANSLTIHDGTPSKLEHDFEIYTKERFIPRSNLPKIASKLSLIPINESLI